jgi:hypothetical protein
VAEEVITVERKDGQVLVTIRRDEGGRPPVEVQYRVSGDCLFQVAMGGKGVDPPLCLLRLPAKPGDTREWAPPADGGAPVRRETQTVGKEAEVEVPGGAVRAIHVENVSTRDGKPVARFNHWYAPGMGLVKVEGKAGDVDFRQVPKSFTPCKK